LPLDWPPTTTEASEFEAGGNGGAWKWGGGGAWEWGGGGKNPLFWVHGMNWEISDCDLWSTWSVIHTSGIYAPKISGHNFLGWQTAKWGLILRNQIYNGGACHWFDQAKQILFEGNTCIGNNPMTMGNNIDTYGGGYAQHIYLGSNHIAQVWGNDREVMTYDNAGQSYFGPVVNVSADGVTYYTEPHPHYRSWTGEKVAQIYGY
jgi:hypothetical protein